jgi:hypothetical protein
VVSVAFAGDNSKRLMSIDGTVVDGLGRPVSVALVALENTQGATVAETVTNSAGHYHFSVAAAGEYTLIAEKGGLRRSAVRVTPSSASGTTIVLEAKQPLTMAVRAARRKAQNDLSRTGVSKYTDA